MAYRSPFGGSYGGEVKIVEVSNTITIDGVEVENTQEAIKAFHENRKRCMEENRKAENERRNQEDTGKFCPLDRYASFPPNCKTTCALYRGNGCAMKREPAAQDTKGKKCPFMRACTEQCALYCGGCTI